VPALSIEMLRVATGVPALAIDDALHIGDVTVPLQPDGTFHVYFGPHDAQRFVSADAVMNGSVDPQLLRDKLVLVGITGLGLLDFQATPLGERIPGVEVHAQILEQIFDGRLLRRPAGASWLEAALLALAGLGLIAVVPRSRLPISVGVFAAALIVLAVLGFGAFRAGVLIDVAAPALGAALVMGTVLAATLAEADRQRRALREAQARVAGELEAARRIQLGLLPDPRRRFAGERRFSLEALLEPARTVGGDFYDCFMLDERRVFFVVADVSGKGLAASLFMALSKSLLKSIALRGGTDPAAMLERAAAEIGRDNAESMFVTAFAGVLDADTGRLTYCNAGHEPPYLCQPGRSPRRVTESGGPPLTVLEGYRYTSAELTLPAGATLCVVTDGVTEAMNDKGELYGAQRLAALLEGLPAVTPQAVRDDVRRFAAGAQPSDDLTLLCIRFSGR
jgi:serine phosphatase RsbU (regulator of sigma subunit)